MLVSCRPELVADAVRERLEAIAERGPVPPADSRRRREAKKPRKKAARITACVVVHDKTAPVMQCLASLEAVADETIVVDAEASEDMAAVRNDALDRAGGGWVLMVDGTHTLDPWSAGRIRRLVRKGRFVGYAAHELHQFGMDGAVSAIQRRIPVLFPLHPDLRYAGRVEEQLLPRRAELEFALERSRDRPAPARLPR